MTGTTALLDIACGLFLIGTLFSVRRRLRTRDKLYSTSLEGTAFNLLGNGMITYICFVNAAWAGFLSELTLTAFAALTLYLKIRWLRDKEYPRKISARFRKAR